MRPTEGPPARPDRLPPRRWTPRLCDHGVLHPRRPSFISQRVSRASLLDTRRMPWYPALSECRPEPVERALSAPRRRGPKDAAVRSDAAPSPLALRLRSDRPERVPHGGKNHGNDQWTAHNRRYLTGVRLRGTGRALLRPTALRIVSGPPILFLRKELGRNNMPGSGAPLCALRETKIGKMTQSRPRLGPSLPTPSLERRDHGKQYRRRTRSKGRPSSPKGPHHAHADQ